MNILRFELTFRKNQLIRNGLIGLFISFFLYIGYLPYENLAYDYLMIYGYLLFSFLIFQSSRRLMEVFTGPTRFFYLGTVQNKMRLFYILMVCSVIEFLFMYVPLLVFQCLTFSSMIQQNVLQVSIISIYGFGLVSLLQSTILYLFMISLVFFFCLHSRFFSFLEAGVWSGFIQYISFTVFLILIHLYTINRFPIPDIFSPVSLFNFSIIDGLLISISCGFLFYWISDMFRSKLDFF